jgi:hypothetical protein
LADYLIVQEENTDLSKVDSDAFLDDLSFPENFLPDGETQELTNFRSQWANYTWNVRIITLNYTRTIERILDHIKVDSSIGTSPYGRGIYYKGIYHIHGYTDARLVLGLNDVSQVASTDFHNNEDILDSLIKIKCNQVQKHNIDKICERIIEAADMICIFGSSIGDTDNYWWELIGNQLRRGCKVIIFSKGEGIRERFSQRAARTKRSITELFLKKTNLSDEEVEEFKKNIYVGVNAKIFNIMR